MSTEIVEGSEIFRLRDIYDLKQRCSPEIARLSLAHAVAELVQFQLDKIIAETGETGWRSWERLDCSDYAYREQLRIKETLLEAFPGMICGPKVTALAGLAHESWLPVFILKAEIAVAELSSGTHRSKLKVCTVLWHHRYDNVSSLTFFQNNIDLNLQASHLMMGDALPGRKTGYGSSGFGKGIRESLQCLYEQIRVENGRPDTEYDAYGVSFRLGLSVGTLRWFDHGDGLSICQALVENTIISRPDVLSGAIKTKCEYS
jgi:hypothetical protein